MVRTYICLISFNNFNLNLKFTVSTNPKYYDLLVKSTNIDL